ADLSDADLSAAHLRAANLRAGVLSAAHLSDADLRDTDLRNANLCGANLSDADLRAANLSDADLSDAHLNGANLGFADLSGALFAHVRFLYTTFAWVDLNGVKALETANHIGPSTVNINTVTLPLDERTRWHFLLGAGFPKTHIEYLPSLLTPRPIQYHSLFISYAHQDEALARRLQRDLRKNDIPCWFAPENLKIGDRIRLRIDEAIHKHEKLLLILSEAALASAWVEKEVETALEKEAQQHRSVLFPIRVDESVMRTRQAWAADVRRMRYIGNFTNWQDDAAYHRAFGRLLRDLQVDEPPVL
ncbi:MAG TPA: toll/interleukin-1 receptor domain-containing protein, partial [Ktedonobacteraceae bacterium]|nr:toll/interleukin-1 receptor domain-containing protein [Ktedonobacteraceae bacterium]